jgi:hypothetical protein
MIANTKNLSVSYDRLLRKINSSQRQETLTNQQNDNVTYTPTTPNTVRYPSAMPSHNSGVLIGIHPNPPGFYPHSFDSVTTNSRRQYLQTQEACDKSNTILQTKYIAPEAYSLRVASIRSNSIGKSSYKEGLPNTSPLSFKGSFNTLTDERRSRRRARSSGCVAPAKKNGINNKAYMYASEQEKYYGLFT